MKSYIRRTGATLLLGIFLLPALTPSVQPKHVRGGFMVALKVSLHKSPAMYRAQAPRGGPNIKAACNKT